MTTQTTSQTSFYDGLVESIEAPGGLEAHALLHFQIKAIDDIMNGLEEARKVSGLSKAELARILEMNPAQVRRSLTSARNLTMRSANDIAVALGMKLALVPIEDADYKDLQKTISEAYKKSKYAKIRRAPKVRKAS